MCPLTSFYGGFGARAPEHEVALGCRPFIDSSIQLWFYLVDLLMTSIQQSFDHLDLPVTASHLHKSISLLQHPAFSGSSSSLKSTDDNDMLSTQGDTVGEARAMVERWCSERARDSTVELQAYNIMLDCMSPTPVDFSKPPRRFWRTSWRALILKLCNPIDTRSRR